jgi:mannose PTS system EIIA component
MSNRILIIAHAPLAQALRDCAMHVYAECSADVIAIDVQPDAQPEDTLAQALDAAGSALDSGLLVLTDIFGATPANPCCSEPFAIVMSRSMRLWRVHLQGAHKV